MRRLAQFVAVAVVAAVVSAASVEAAQRPPPSRDAASTLQCHPAPHIPAFDTRLAGQFSAGQSPVGSLYATPVSRGLRALGWLNHARWPQVCRKRAGAVEHDRVAAISRLVGKPGNGSNG